MLKSGFSRVDITPPLGLPLSGYFRRRPASGVLDPLEINAIAIGDGENTAVILAADFAIMTKDRCDIIRKKVAERCGIPTDNVMVTALHQHTSLRISFADIIIDMMSEFDGFSDDNFIEMLYRKFCDAAQMAMDDMKPSTVSVGIRETAEPISFIRRYIMKDGSLQTNPGTFDPSEIDRMNGTPDNNVRLVKFVREGANDIALVNFSTHPDVVGGDKYSADWPGFARRFVEKKLDGVSCLLILGFQGDSNHLDFIGGRRSGYEHARFMGEQISDAVVSMWNGTETMADGNVSCDMETVQLKTRDIDEAKILEAQAYCREYDAGKIDIKRHLAEVAEAKQIACHAFSPKYRAVPISHIKIGNISIIGFGGEPFTEYGEKIRAFAPNRFVIGACLANGAAHYFPTKAAFEEGGFEARSAHFLPECEEKLLSAAKSLLDK